MGKLRKELKQIDVWGLAFGAIVGTGCFFLPGTKFIPKSGPLGMIIGIVLGMIMILVISNNYSFMIKRYPKAGGEYIFTKENIGIKNASICGWFLVLAYIVLIPLNATALAIIIKNLFPGIIEVCKLYTIAGYDVYLPEIIIAEFVIIIFTIINLSGVKGTGAVQTAIALFLLISVLLIIIGILLNCDNLTNLKPGFASEKKIENVLVTLAIAPFLFIGFDCIPQAAEEYRFSANKSKFIMYLAIIIATIMYISVMLCTAIPMPRDILLGSSFSWETGEAVNSVLGACGLTLLGGAMVCAALSGINAFFLASSRLIYSLSEDGIIPNKFAIISNKGVPRNAIIFVAIVSLIAPFGGRQVLNWIVDMTSVGGAIAYFYTSFSACKIAMAEKNCKQTIIGIFGSIFSLCFLVLLLFPVSVVALTNMEYILLAVWMVLGLIFFCLRNALNK